MLKLFFLLFFLLSASGAAAQEPIESIPVYDQQDIDSIRNLALDYIWPSGTQDSAHIISIEDEPATEAMAYLQNLGHVERITLSMKNSFTSIVRLLHPEKANPVNLPVIYHGGHGGVFWEDRYLNKSGRPYSVSVIDFLLGKGYDVVCLDMPLTNENTCPVPVMENGDKYIFSHDDIFKLQQPFYYFFEPVRRIIDFLEEQRGYEMFSMIGLSGGGWTTTLYSALDTRIVQSFSVAGSVPVPSRLTNSDKGDREQHDEALYNQVNYSTFYTLAASGNNRLHYQILNQNDDCCFDYNADTLWAPAIQQKLQELGYPGQYLFYYDPYATMHKISSAAMDTIYSHMREDLIRKYASRKISLTNTTENSSLCNGSYTGLKLSTVRYYDNIEWYNNGNLVTRTTKNILDVNTNGEYYAKVIWHNRVIQTTDTIAIHTINLRQPTITQKKDSLFSDSPLYNQWYLNGIAIPGATNKSFKPVTDGAYTVKLLKENCESAVSPPFVYGILFYPNPARNEINIRLSVTLGVVNIELFDMQGKLMLKDVMKGEKRIYINSKISTGLYLVKLSNAEGLIGVKKVLIQQ